MKKKKQHQPIPAAECSFDDLTGIYIPLEFLAREDLLPSAKIIYAIIKRELTTKRKTFTTDLTDTKLSKMAGISISTVQRSLSVLDEKKLIGAVSLNRATKRDAQNRPKDFRGIRWIYLDRKLAGYRLRAINQDKKPVEMLYSLFVLEGRASPEAYVKFMRNEAIKSRMEEEQREEAREAAYHLRAFKESLADVSDDLILEMELDEGKTPGTYLAMKTEYLKELAELESKYGGDNGDDLFDDNDDAGENPITSG